MVEYKKVYNEYKEVIIMALLIGIALSFAFIIISGSNSYNYKQGFFDGASAICQDKPLVYKDNILVCFDEQKRMSEVFENEVRFFNNDEQS